MSEVKTNSNFKQTIKRGWDVVIMRMGKLAEQKHMAALRDGFALLVPLIISASIGVICMTLVFGWAGTASTSILGWIVWGIPGQMELSSQGIYDFVPGTVSQQISSIGIFVFYTIWKGIFSYLSVFITLTLSYSLARAKESKEPFIASLVGLLAFMILTYGDPSLFGTTGILVAMLASMLSIEIYAKLEKSTKLELKMPAGVPPAVARAFSKLFPSMITLMLFVALQAPFIIFRPLATAFGVGDAFGIGHTISTAIQAPFIGIASQEAGSLAIGLTYTFFVSLLWFFGVHGSNVLLAVFSPITTALIQTNLDYREGIGTSLSAFGGGSVDAFVFFGGAGTTLAFVIVGLLFSKRKETREILKFGGAPSLFNINEPLLFGVPLILNFKYVVPFVLVNPVLFFITWLAIEKLKWVAPVVIAIPWTAPVGIGGFLASGWQGLLLSLFNLIVAVSIYTPFVFLANKSAKKKGEELVKIDYKQGFQKIFKKGAKK
ncbi:MAG: PTS sugar transporter subunit IIC [Metamycoplasmataceae bacterium]